MNFFKLFFLALCGGPLLVSFELFAQSAPAQKDELLMSKENYQKIFSDSYNSSLEKEFSPQKNDFKGQLQYGQINELILQSKYFTVPYSDVIQNAVSVEAALERRLLRLGRYQLSAAASWTYSYLEKKMTIYPSAGGQLVDVVRLHWLPLGIGPTLSYQIPVGSSALTLATGLKGGWQWLSQSGSLDGMNQNFLVPFYNIEGAISYGLGKMNLLTEDFDQSLFVSATRLSSLDEKQKVQVLKLGAGLVIRI